MTRDERRARNRARRQRWIDAAPGWPLCSWCRFAREFDWGQACEHPLDTIGDWDDIEPGDDCWGFRPRKGLFVEDAAEIVARDRGERGEP